MKYIHVCTWLLMSVFLTSCAQNQKSAPAAIIKSEINDVGPNIMALNIKQGRNGSILIAGTNNASLGDVFRYDGTSFINLTTKIGPRQFRDVLEDKLGNVWFTTTDSGAYYYNGKSMQHFTTADGLASNRVMSVCEDGAGVIWLGTGNGVSRYDGKSFQNFITPNTSNFYKKGNWNNDITTTIKDRTGKLWVGTRGDAYVYDGKTFKTLTHNGRPFTNVWSIIEDKKGNIWLGDVTNGLWRYDGSTFTRVSERGTYAVMQDKKGNIWTTGPVNSAHVAVWAVSRYDARSLYSKEPLVTEIMTGKTFLGILEANDGNIWFGDATGVYRYDGKIITDFYNKAGQKKYNIDIKQSAVIWKGAMLMGAWDGAMLVGDGTRTGKLAISKGHLLIDNSKPVGGAVEIDMNTIEQKFDNQRPRNKLPDFFDLKKFPSAKFEITKVETTNDGKSIGNGNMTIEAVANIKITGNLSVEGVTKAVTFPATMYFKNGMDGTVVMNGTLTVDRTDWGIDYRSEKNFAQSGDLTISDNVKLFVKIVAKKHGR